MAYAADMQRNGGEDYAGVGVASEAVPESGNGGGQAYVALAGDGGCVFDGSNESDIRRCCTEHGRTQWETEPGVGRVADGIPNRVERLRGLGNAVVPQLAEYIGRLVVQHYGRASSGSRTRLENA